MIVKRSMKKTISKFIIFAMVFASLSSGFSRNTQAAMSSKDLSSTYLNATIKYLNFGQRDAKTYNFNIKKEVQKKGAVYSWYVNEDKGNPDSVTIDKKTGVVTAKKAGTAYIRCKITLADGSVLRPEAKVVVRNNITKVDISNMPKDQTIIAGETMDFNRSILDTDAGKDKRSTGITRWEIDKDTAGVDKVTESGVVFPLNKGSFSIRAVSFQSNQKYNLWLKDKATNHKYITAASQWYKVTVEDSEGTATVSTQEELEKAVASKDITQITLSTKEDFNFFIAKGDYSNKILIVDAPNADVDNYAIFNRIIIRAIKENTWNENANGNIFQVNSIKIRIIVNGTAEIKEIIFDRQDSVIFLEVDGKVHQITVLQPSELFLSGDGVQIPITIEKTGDGSVITTSIPLKLECDENSEIVLNPGSEGSTINKNESKTELKIINNSNQSVVITTNNAGGETIRAGETGISNDATKPTAAPTLERIEIITPAIKTVYLVGETLDITGLVIEGTYSNTSKRMETISASNISGFDSTTVVASQTLTISIKGKTLTYTVTINPIPVENISVSPATMTLTAGGATGILSPIITPTNAANKTVTWTSSDETIATVDNGIITPVASGTVVISVTTEDGNKIATGMVSVNLLDLSAVNLNVLAGCITGTTVFMEYSVDSTNGTDGIWSDCTALLTSVTFTEGKVYVRAKAEPGNFRLVNSLLSPLAPILVYDDVANSITGLDNTYEYRIASGVWTSGEITGDFSGTKTVHVRFKATSNALPSQNQTIIFTTNLVLTGVGINIASGNITGTEATMEYSLNSTTGTDGIWADCSVENTTVAFGAGKVYIRAKVQPGNFRIVATIATEIDAPALPSDDLVNSIIGLDNTYEYKIGEGEWTSGEIVGDFSGMKVVQVRRKATADTLPSQLQTIHFTTNLVLTGVGIDVVIGNITGTATTMEYSLNSTTGSDGNWFDCSEGNTTVAFIAGFVYIRAKAQPVNYRLVATIAAPADAPSLVSDDVANSITGLGITYEYKINDGIWTSGETAGDFSLTKAVQVRLKATASALPSQIQTINFTTNLVLTGVGINVAVGNITGTEVTMEYSLNSTTGTNGDWFDCSEGSTEVTFIEGKVYIRAKIQPGNYRLVAIVAAPTAPVLAFDDVANSISGLDNTYEYKIDSEGWTSGEIIGDFTGEKEVGIRLKSTAASLPSQVQIINFTTNLILTGVGINVAAGNITGTATTMEYSLNSTTGTDGDWYDCSADNTTVIFVAGKVYVRAKIQPLNYRLVTTVAVPAAPVLVYDDVANSITGLDNTYEYRIASGVWTSGEITGDYTGDKEVGIRLKANADVLPSLIQTISFTTNLVLTGVGINVAEGNITGTTTLMQFSLTSTTGTDGIWIDCSETSTAAAFVTGRVYIRAKIQPLNYHLVETLATPVNAPSLSYDDLANTIIGLDHTFEYSMNEGTWTSGEIVGDFSGDKVVKVRLKATAYILPSQIQTINFTANLDLTGVGINITAGNITGTTTGMQYSLNSTNGINGSWINCSADNTVVTFVEGLVYVRAKAQYENFRLVDTVSQFTLTVTGVNSSTNDGYYKAGSTILINVTFDGAVIVTGTPKMNLETGINDRVASYTGGSGTTVLTFNYTVQPLDSSLDLDYTAANALILSGGTIRAKGTVFNANLTLPSPGAAGSLGYARNFIIDNIAPTDINISAMNTILGNQNVTLTATGGPLSTDSWNNILNLIKANTAISGYWITGITSDKLTITPSGEGSTATLNNVNATAATIVRDFILPAALVVDKAGNIASGDIRINSCNSGVTSIALTDSFVVFGINNSTPDLYIAYAKTAGQLKHSLEGLDGSPQTYAITDSSNNPKIDTSILLLGDKLIVTSENGLNNRVYPIRVAPEPITTIKLKAGAPNASSTVIDNISKLYILSRVTDMTVGQVKSALISTDGSSQTYAITDLLGHIITDDTSNVTSSNRLIVTAYDGVTKGSYEIRVDWSTISIGHISVVEGNSGTVDAVFILRRLGPTTSSLIVPYYTEHIWAGVYPAEEGSDYIGVSGNITFNPGEVIKTITVQVIGDTIKEEDEVFRLVVQDNSDPLARVVLMKNCTIINDD